MKSKLISDDNFKKFASILEEKTKDGFEVVEQNDKLPYAVLKKAGEKVNHNLNFFICCVTLGIWTIPWIYITQVSSKAKKILVAIDEDGNAYVDKCF
ncbi:NGP1NT (NUC091) domain-containing protein [Flavobacterium segetis]|uniref:NGP1NT (NUC091) domain-containing protein n=1 Tax=Flavobacterium segetis TaxID=271157 RepID=A0A1M5HIE5_9FLAO|nr:hypothetical protein [Flavobacterium segetis]SHG15582.1 NGP1NT (NUC091) domain-containing protein [Flavobacterium segetis]